MSKRIITISREFGSGGRSVGKALAKRLGWKYYDKELVKAVAEKTGFDPRFIEERGEFSVGKSLLSYALAGQGMPGVMNGMSASDFLWCMQREVILKLAEEGGCVIVGRCGDYVLRDRKDVLRIFVYAPKEWRLAYGKENNMLQAKDEKGIKDEIDKTDRNRAAYYNYYTQNRWGDAHNYDLAINAALGHDACVNMILAAAEAKEKTMEG